MINRIAVTGSWSLDIFLESIDDGKLNIRLNWPDNIKFRDWSSNRLNVEGLDTGGIE